jgi:hypothetical protein
MIFILLCILVNTGLILVFRLFPKYGIDSFQAIVANYFVAAFLGFQIASQPFNVRFYFASKLVAFYHHLGNAFCKSILFNFCNNGSFWRVGSFGGK